MTNAARRNIAAGTALAAAGVVALTPIAPAPPNVHSATLGFSLAAAVTSTGGVKNSNGATIPTGQEVDQAIANGDIRNIPLNLLYALSNVPYSETKAINHVAASLLYTGNWWVASGTNVWGEDAADPGHFESIISLGSPYPALSDVMGYQTAMVAAALLPASQSCNAAGCVPLTPATPLTGLTVLDRLIYSIEIVAGLREFPLTNNWFSRAALEGLMSEDGFYFSEEEYANVSPGRSNDNEGAVPTQEYRDSMGNVFTFVGTKTGESTDQQVMPWAGSSFVWDPMLPWKALYASLVSTPPADGEYGTGIKVATPEDTIYAYQALLAGLVVDFNLLVPGSPWCPGACDTTLGITTPVIVKAISDLYPGNPMLEQWLEYEKAGEANGPTDEQIVTSIDILQSGLFNFDEETVGKIDAALAGINPVLPNIARNSGLLDGWNPNALLKDIADIAGVTHALQDVIDVVGADERVQNLATRLTELNTPLTERWQQVDAQFKDANAKLTAMLNDLGDQLGADDGVKAVNETLTGLGSALHEAGSFRTDDSSTRSVPPSVLTAANNTASDRPAANGNAVGDKAFDVAGAPLAGAAPAEAPQKPTSNEHDTAASAPIGTDPTGANRFGRELTDRIESAGERVTAGWSRLTEGKRSGNDRSAQTGSNAGAKGAGNRGNGGDAADDEGGQNDLKSGARVSAKSDANSDDNAGRRHRTGANGNASGDSAARSDDSASDSGSQSRAKTGGKSDGNSGDGRDRAAD